MESGAPVDAIDPNGNTAPIAAANNGYADAVNMLLKYGANPNTRNYRGETALMLAAAAGHATVASLLIESSADVQANNW
ncbi:MAG: ankyrin repeat domain-containing protein [Deltaproteobacteria bacterium]|nr:ankyrin repeat domain-containing protein [Deltaproteobacteria bacterium]